MNWRGCGRKPSWSDLWHCHGTEENYEKPHDSQYPGQALSPVSQEYETGLANSVCLSRAKFVQGSVKYIVKKSEQWFY